MESAEIAFALALFYSELGDLNSAVEELQSTVKLEPGFARAWYNLAVALFRTGKKQDAISAIDKAIETDPSNREAYTQARSYFTNSEN